MIYTGVEIILIKTRFYLPYNKMQLIIMGIHFKLKINAYVAKTKPDLYTRTHSG